MKKMLLIGAVGVSLLIASAASADVFTFQGTVPSGGLSQHTFPAANGDRITSAIFHAGSTDTVMLLSNPANAAVHFDDDLGIGTQSSIRHNADMTGNWRLTVSGYPDTGFTGSPSTFGYQLVVSTGATGSESGSNSTLATANPLVLGTSGSAMDGALTPGDVDFFSFQAIAGELMSAQLDDLFDGLALDSRIALMNAGGTVLQWGEDEYGYNSLIQYVIPSSGTYYIAVTGSGDSGYTGNHNRQGIYRLVVSGREVPSPAGAALLGMAGMASVRRRRRCGGAAAAELMGWPAQVCG